MPWLLKEKNDESCSECAAAAGGDGYWEKLSKLDPTGSGWKIVKYLVWYLLLKYTFDTWLTNSI